MAKNKTQPTKARVTDFLANIEDSGKRADCKRIAKMMRAATGKRATMWGSSIVGYGSYDYRYASGREGSFMETGFSPRAQNITIYIMPGFAPYRSLMKRLGKHKAGKSCLYIKRLDDVDTDVLGELIRESVEEMRRRYPGAS
ncbi:MAG: DUF1801 domain-containing protein [Pseudomonadota bacterium]